MRSIYASWESGDFSSAAWAHPEIEYARLDIYWTRERALADLGLAPEGDTHGSP